MFGVFSTKGLILPPTIPGISVKESMGIEIIEPPDTFQELRREEVWALFLEELKILRFFFDKPTDSSMLAWIIQSWRARGMPPNCSLFSIYGIKDHSKGLREDCRWLKDLEVGMRKD